MKTHFPAPSSTAHSRRASRDELKRQAAQLATRNAEQAARIARAQKLTDAIYSIAETVARDWFRRCMANPVRMTLYWRKPREGEKAACPIVDLTPPNADFTADIEISPAWTRDVVARKIADRMRELPCMGAEWFA